MLSNLNLVKVVHASFVLRIEANRMRLSLTRRNPEQVCTTFIHTLPTDVRITLEKTRQDKAGRNQRLLIWAEVVHAARDEVP